MRRALGLVSLVVVGVLIGFLIRLVWPRRQHLSVDSYTPVEALARDVRA